MKDYLINLFQQFIIDNGLGYNCILSNKSDKSLVRYMKENDE